MFESDTLNIPELAARWGKSQREILDAAANLRFHLLFNFDGLVIDAKGDKLARFYSGQEREHERLSEFVKSAEAKFQRRIHGQLSQFESLTDSEAGELRKQVTDAEAKIQIFKELSDIVTRERLKCCYRGYLRAAPATIDEMQRLGSARHPIRAYRPEGPFNFTMVDDEQVLDGPLVRLEAGAAQWKARLEPADMIVSMAEVRAIEVAAKPQEKSTSVERGTVPGSIVAPLVSAGASVGVDTVPNWKMQIQAEATALCLRLRKSGANPTKSSILNPMAKWCRDNKVMTGGKIFPSANYLRTHVLGGGHWELPN